MLGIWEGLRRNGEADAAQPRRADGYQEGGNGLGTASQVSEPLWDKIVARKRLRAHSHECSDPGCAQVTGFANIAATLSARTNQRAWTLSQVAFEVLLANLDPDRDRAGQKYELLRLKIMKFFTWQTIPSADDLTDDVLNIAARKLSEGEQIGNLSAYCLAVARNLVMERVREQRKQREALQDPSFAPAKEAGEDRERLLEQLERCLAELPAADRSLLLTYYGANHRARIEARKALAGELGIPLNALRIRAWRLRARLEAAILQEAPDTEK